MVDDDARQNNGPLCQTSVLAALVPDAALARGAWPLWEGWRSGYYWVSLSEQERGKGCTIHQIAS